jgi:hypothetical protein
MQTNLLGVKNKKVDPGQELILQKFEIDPVDPLSEEALLEILANRISEMLDNETDLLFSTLYRLDIDEYMINRVIMTPDIPNDIGLAKLVLQRQKQKIETRKKYKIEKKDDWFDF